ncbi:c-type cytochrome [Algoriphagus sp. CAU 1675]|uniref:c-type cytochrome n=1 Tax=Algoriphagus sp. CAU 1675 TaxID=3032597 RepID=UPI0023DAA134|nr:c-type cytochrome [Algoriphagus sp. CAU 1675]MDF2156350.1 c-type cytochrome [Algoriphagus sp. CAU 1675]
MIRKILTGLVLFVLVLGLGLIILAQTRYDRTFEAPYPDIRASTDSALIARGKYLVYGPSHCAHCHSPMENIALVDQGEITPLSGGFNFELPIGTVYSPNITPDPETGIGNYTDGELARVLRYGVKKNGQALMDFMPFYDMSEYDITAIISFLRSQSPIKNERPNHEFNLLGKLVFALAIQPQGDGDVPPTPAAEPTVEYGKYLVNTVANCKGCHTQRNMATGAYTAPDLSGGAPFEYITDEGKIDFNQYFLTPNLTPDPETGRLEGWTEETFINRFRQGKLITGSPMPWGPFTRMSDLELSAIFKYLQSLPPIKNPVPLGVQQVNAE